MGLITLPEVVLGMPPFLRSTTSASGTPSVRSTCARTYRESQSVTA